MAKLDEVLAQLAGPRSNTLETVATELGAGELGSGVRGLATQVELLRSLFQTQAATTRENTDALRTNTQAAANSGGFANAATNVARTASSVLGGGIFASPLIGGLLKLFGVGHSRPAEPAPLTPFALPRPVSLDGMLQNGGTSALAGTQYGQDGLPRPTPPSAARTSAVTVNINAIDSRSFMDHSDEIARAVRQAMLDSHSLNDVVAEI